MDKLKEQLAVAKEHSFWILCVGILIFSLVSWYISTGNLQTKQKQYKGEIESAVSTLKQVTATPDHPNDSTSKGMDLVMQKFGEDVYAAWMQLAENQKQVLVWEGVFADEPFQKEVRPLQPIETKVADLAEPINRDNRRLYRDFIDVELPKLADLILAKWQVDVHSLGSGGMPGMGGGTSGPPGGGLSNPMGMGGVGPPGAGGMPGMGGGIGSAAKDDDPNVVVIWNPENQKQITQMHFGMATNSVVPSSLDVLYAQEDLWVFQNLMQIIKNTNGDALRKHEAAIKYIDYVRIGLTAGDVVGQVTLPGGNNNSGSGNMTQGGMPGMAGGAGMPGMAGGAGMPGAPGGGTGGGSAAAMMAAMAPGGNAPGATGAPGAAAGSAPTAATTSTAASDRYVDLSYASIKDINRLRSAMKGAPTKPQDMLLAVAKRMPVRMQFKMDQRKLTTLLAECGNSKVPLEVRQVRINRGTASSTGGGGMGGMGGAGMGGSMPGMPTGTGAGIGSEGGGAGYGGSAGGAARMMGMMGGTGGAGARPVAGIASSKEDPNEITVEIYGIVYIYNPPERKLLGLEPTVTTPPAAVPGPVTTPASTSPTTPAKPPLTAGAATGR